VIWQEHPDGNKFDAPGPGKSIYADSDVPNPVNEDFLKVSIVVTLDGVAPAGGGVVTLDFIDPPNAHEFGTDDDNFSESFSFETTTLTFLPGEWEKTTTVSLSQNAGDNYIIEATANNGKPNNVVYSEILTVWRRLWVECDQMAMPGTDIVIYDINGKISDTYFKTSEKEITWDDVVPTPEPVTFDLRKQPDKPNISLLNTLMNRACVTDLEYQYNNTPVVAFVPNLWTEQIMYNNPAEMAQYGREIPNATESFWTMYVLGAYELSGQDHDIHNSALPGGDCRDFTNGINTGNAYVFCETIRDVTNTHGNCPGVTGTLADYNTFFKRVVAHEILHSFL